MVIVTTAVYWGLNSQLRPKRLTNPLNLPALAGVSPYTSSYDFARTCVFDKQSLPRSLRTHTRSRQQVPITLKVPFSRSYGGILPSSLTMILSIALVFLYLITCVGLGYGRLKPRRCFSRQHRITKSPKQGPITSQAHSRRI